ncbi:MAG: hypothetical protein J6W76_05535 [Spirochaetales bacterium]|nr:hypothetical protein [Spirochaetales bacterium]
MHKNKILLLIILLFTLVSCEQYKIGEKGLGGGTIFYISKAGFTLKGSPEVYHYMECSGILSKSVSWCSQQAYSLCCEIDTAEDIGSGKANTETILGGNHSGGELNENNCAAMVCHNYSTETTKAGDWWLPSKDELGLIYTNIAARGLLANISPESSDSGWFWSSSTDHEAAHRVLGIGMSSGKFDSGNKNDQIAVIAVRAF